MYSQKELHRSLQVNQFKEGTSVGPFRNSSRNSKIILRYVGSLSKRATKVRYVGSLSKRATKVSQ